MNPREITVHIEELVLDGFPESERYQVGDALQHELRGLLAKSGLPPSWLANSDRIDAGAIRTISRTKSADAGAQIADAVYRGGTK